MQSACLALHCHLWSVWLYLVFTHTFINGTNFEEEEEEEEKKIQNYLFFIFSTTDV